MKNKNWILIGLFVSIVLSVALMGGFFRVWQDKLTDLLFTKKAPNNSIVILSVDEETIRSVGQWPWPRSVFGNVLQKIKSARVVGIDVNFKEPSGRGSGDDDIFASVLSRSAYPVILSAELQADGTMILPIEKFRSVTSQAFTNLNISADGVARRVQAKVESFEGFGFKIAEIYKPEIKPDIAKYADKAFRINYHGTNNTFTSLSFNDVLAGKVPDDFFKNKIVLIGVTVADLHDFHQTPLGIISGVEIQANIIQTFIGKEIFTASRNADLLIVVLLAFVSSWLSFKIKKFFKLIFSVVLILVVYNVVAFVFFDKFFILDIFYPNLAIILSSAGSISLQYLITHKEKKFIQESFSRYLAPQVVEELVNDPSRLKLGGVRRNLTILFSDIRGFTGISEKMDPEELTSFLNRYLGTMTDVVLKNNGVIDKYIGDAVMAFWGAPLDDAKHALNSILSALEMAQKLDEFNSAKKPGEPDIKIGIGLNSGEVTVGNMGSEKRFDYTVIGDNVNLASRLEGLNKFYGTSIIVSQKTLEMLDDADFKKYDIVSREIDKVVVKGKKDAVRIYQIIPRAFGSKVVPILNEFEKGISSYYDGDFKVAVGFFESILGRYEDGPSRLLLERCQQLVGNPPKEWQGVFELTSK